MATIGPYRFELGVYDPQADAPITCEQYLKRHGSGEVAWIPDPEDSAIFLEADGHEWLAGKWNLGNLNLVVSQLDNVHRRLEARQTAILRSAVVDQPYAPYFLFESPQKATDPDFVRISQFFILDPAFGKLFPIHYWSGSDPRKLFDYVEANRTRVLSEDPWHVPGKSRLSALPFPRAELLNALPVQAALGREILELARTPT